MQIPFFIGPHCVYCLLIYILWSQWPYLLFIDEDLRDKKRNVDRHTVGYKSDIWKRKTKSCYSVSHISIHPPDFSRNQGNHQNFEKSLLSYKCWLIFIGMKQKKIFFEKKIQNGRLKKTEFFNYHQKLSNCRQNFMDWSLG